MLQRKSGDGVTVRGRPRKTAAGPGCPQVQGCYRDKGRDEFICWWGCFPIAPLSFFVSEIGNEVHLLRGKPEQDRRLRPTVWSRPAVTGRVNLGRPALPSLK